MKFPYTKAERRDARMVRQLAASRNARAVSEAIAACRHDFGKEGTEALCQKCGCIRPLKTK